MSTRFVDHLLTGDHASRPAANTVPKGTLYACSTHLLIYQSDGSSWSTWASLVGTGGSGTVTSVDVSVPGGFSVSGTPVTISGTIAIAASGTSGGVPYYSGSTTMASSAALAANQFVRGGGAGAAPVSAGALTDGQLFIGSTGAPPVAAALTAGSNITITPAAGSITIAAAGGGSGAATSDPFVIGQGTAADLSAKVQISGLTGSADINGAAGAGTAQEFDGADPLTWSANPTSFDCNTTIKSYYYLTDSAATAKYGYVAWSPAGAFDARWKVSAGADHANGSTFSPGVWIGDSGNTNGLLLTFGTAATSPDNFVCSAYTDASGSFTQRGANQRLGGGAAYFRITRDGSNNCSFYYSTDGLTWRKIATQSLTFTVARLGFRINSESANLIYFACDWMRTSV